MLVEGNPFNRCSMPAILVEDDAEGWFESGPVRDMTIRDNSFIGCGIAISPQNKSVKADEPVHENIRIEGNFFDGSGISAKSVRGLTIVGNRSSGGDIPISTNACTDVKAEDNATKAAR